MADVSPLDWPRYSDGRLMLPLQVSCDVVSSSRSGGQSQSGTEQVVSSPAAQWAAKMTMPPLRAVDLLTWRGFVADMGGRVGTVLMPAFEFGRQPWPVDQWGRVISPGAARNPRLQGTAYAVDPVADAAASIRVTCAAASINSTTLVLTSLQSGPILAGHRFSIGSNLFEIRKSVAVGNVYTVSVRPWARIDIGAGAICEFRSPICLMRFKTDTEGALDLSLGRFASPDVNFVEVF